MYKRVEQAFYVLSSFALLGVMFVAAPNKSIAVKDFQNEIISQVATAWQPISPSAQPIKDLALVYEGVDSFYKTSAKHMAAAMNMPQAVPAAERLAYALTQPSKDIALVYQGVQEFYGQSSDAMIALLTPRPGLNTELLAYQFANLINVPQIQNRLAINGTAKAPEVAEKPKAKAFDEWASEYSLDQLERIAVGLREQAPQQVQEAGLVAGATEDSTYYELNQPVNTPEHPWVTLKDEVTGEKYCIAVYDGEVNKYQGPCKYDYH